MNIKEIEQEFKELNLYLDDLYNHKQMDAGNLWIQFSDKFNAFRTKIIAALSHAEQEKKIEELETPTEKSDMELFESFKSIIENKNLEIEQLKSTRNTYAELNNRLSEDLRTANGIIAEWQSKQIPTEGKNKPSRKIPDEDLEYFKKIWNEKNR